MDAFTLIVLAAGSLISLYVGYLIGNFYPVFKSKRKGFQNQKLLGERLKSTSQMIINANKKGTTSKNNQAFSEIEELSDIESTKPSGKKRTPSSKLLLSKDSARPQVVDDTLVLWYTEKDKKLYAQVKGDTYEIDETISQDTQNKLAVLLIELQERIGISSTLKKKIDADIDKILETTDDPSPIVKPTFNPLKSIIRYVQSDIPSFDSKEVSIPKQINEILQSQLKGSALEGMGISLSEWPMRGVVFNVGLSVYDEIEAIPSPEIQAAIQKAVQTWENQRSEP